MNFTICADCRPPVYNLTCPSEKWKMTNGSIVSSPLHCNFSTQSAKERTGGWFITDDDNVTTEVTEGSCSFKYNCSSHSNLQLDCSTDECVKATNSWYDARKINCSEGYYLRYGEHSGRSIICNASDGLYYSPDRVLPRDAKVFCLVKPNPQADLIGYVMLGVFFPIAIAFAIWVFFFLSNADYPVYLRGMHWAKVEDHLQEDLTLSDAIIPTNYIIDLSVNARGYGGADKSTFNGFLVIDMNFTRATNSIELHSRELTIQKVSIIGSRIDSAPISVVNITHNKNRESIKLFVNRTIIANEKMILEIHYNGSSDLSEYGLHEIWNPDPVEQRFVLATNNFSTGARFWFPCFDEPAKRAHFQLRIDHTTELIVYSNMPILRNESISAERRVSIFETTPVIGTHQVSLALNDFGFEQIKSKKFKVRLIKPIEPYGENDIMERTRKFESSLAMIEELAYTLNVSIEIETLDIILLHGARDMSIQPGLIIAGRDLIDFGYIRRTKIQDFTQLVFGNTIGIRSINDNWMNELFTHYYDPNDYTFQYETSVPFELRSSLFDLDSRHDSKFLTSSKLRHSLKRSKLPEKAGQLLKLIRKLNEKCIDKSIQEYHTKHAGKFADFESLIGEITENCGKSVPAKAIAADFINQPGKALVSVSRKGDVVTIKQTRFLSTFFEQTARNNTTRYTIPLVYTTNNGTFTTIFRKNETVLELIVPSSSRFTLDYRYHQVYRVFYEDPLAPLPSTENSEASYQEIGAHVRFSMLNGLEMGWINLNRYFELMKANALVSKVIGFFETSLTRRDVLKYVIDDGYTRHNNNEEQVNRYKNVSCDKLISWDELFNNRKFSALLTGLPMLRKVNGTVYDIACLSEWHNVSTYTSFLRDNFIGRNLHIRPDSFEFVQYRMPLYEAIWPQLIDFYFREIEHATPAFYHVAPFVLHTEEFSKNFDSRLTLLEDYDMIRRFVRENPRAAASISTEIARKFERAFIVRNRGEYLGGIKEYHRKNDELSRIILNLQ